MSLTMPKVTTLIRRVARQFLPINLQVKVGLTPLRASVDPLAPFLMELNKTGPLCVVEIGTRYGESIRYIAGGFRSVPIPRLIHF